MKSQRPHPEFVKIDPQQIEQDLIQGYEQKTGKTLYPAQIEHLFVNQVSYALTRALSAIQHTGEQMLVEYSEAPIIDYLGDLVGVTRLPAQSATTILRFSLPETTRQDTSIPVFTEVTNDAGNIIFHTSDNAVIKAGELSIDVLAICQHAGNIGNGFAAGKINTLVSALPDLVDVANITITNNGYNEESTPALRKRIILAPESYSNAGSYGAYEFHVRSAHQSIIDVAVLGPQEGTSPGHIEIYPLTDKGLPDQELLNIVDKYVSADKRRPLTDYVRVKQPGVVYWQLQAVITLYPSTPVNPTLQLAQQTIKEYVQQLQSQLGIDVVPAQIIQALRIAGIYDVELIQPAKIITKKHQWAYCTAISLIVREE